MSNSIKSGTGNGNSANVDIKNRLHTGSISRSERDAAIADGRYYIMSTGVVNLSDDVETPIIYIKNSDAIRNVYLDIFISTTGLSASGTGNVYLRSHVQLDSSSTIITEAKPALVGNANTTSQETFNGDVFKGETGDTFVNTIQFVAFVQQPGDPQQNQILAVLPKNGDVCFTFEAPTGNTDMDVSIIITAYYLDTELPT